MPELEIDLHSRTNCACIYYIRNGWAFICEKERVGADPRLEFVVKKGFWFQEDYLWWFYTK